MGVLVPPGNVTIEREFRLFTPPHVGLHFNRLSRPVSISTNVSLLSMLDSLERAAVDLAQCHPHLIVFGCTSGSFLGGSHDDERIASDILSYTGIPGMTASAAVVQELSRHRDRLGMKKLFMLAPYPDDICRKEVTFLESRGFKVQAWTTFGCTYTEQTLAINSEEVTDRLRAYRAKIMQCDGIFISCTNLLTMDQLTLIEFEFGMPVVSSNQAMLSCTLSALRVQNVVASAPITQSQ